MKLKIHTPRMIPIAIAAGVLSAGLLSSAFAAQAADDAEALAQEAWHEAITQTEVSAEGCSRASYPSMEWEKIECAQAPHAPVVPRSVRASNIVGNGTDYVARVSSGLISKTVGSFPVFTTTGEEDGGSPNNYTLQLNTNSQNCPGEVAGCSAFIQFFYGPGEGFFQYWLIGWNTTCPSGWNTYPFNTTYCYRSSASVLVPAQPVSSVLQTVKLSATAKAGGFDRMFVTVGTTVYTTSLKEGVLKLAPNWTESEFNIFGNCCGNEAIFNAGTHIKVRVGVTNGTTDAPLCVAAGLTLEYTNLTLGKKCTATGGTYPNIVFTEAN